MKSIQFGSEVPDYVEESGFSAEVIDGKVEGLTLLTRGLDVQIAVAAMLDKKFGKPTTARVEIAQDSFGVKFRILHSTWFKGGTLIRFVGREHDSDYGTVVVRSAKLRKIEDDQARKEAEGIP